MMNELYKIALVLAVAVGFAASGAAYNQATVYAYDEDGYTVDGVTITVEGVSNDYYEQKTTDSNHESFFDYTAGEEYTVTVEEDNGDRYAQQTEQISSRDSVFITMDSEGGGDPGDPNEPPSVQLENPDDGETGVDVRPEFRWDGDDPDNDNLDYEFYLEQKSYSSDRPWSDNPVETDEESYTPSSDLENGEEYVWGVKVTDEEGETDREHRSFTVEEEDEDTNSPPEIDLEEPDSNENNVDLRPDFEWSGSDPENDDLEYDFYLEERSYSSDRPWSDNPESTTDTSLTPSSDLEEDTEYVWGVKVTDEEGETDREYRYFTTREEDDNSPPSVDLEYPDANQENVDLRPTFEWDGDDPENDDLEYDFYIEERSYGSDRPWSADPVSENDDSKTLGYDLDEDTEYVWGVKVTDEEGETDREYRYFTTREEDDNSAPSVDLDEPGNNDNDVSLRPGFEWSGYDSDGDDIEYSFYLEERTYDDDRPWSDSPDTTSRTYRNLDYDLDEDTEYVWGVEARDGNGGEDREYRYFTTRDSATCDVDVSDLQLGTDTINRGESTDASFTITNDGDTQEFDVRLRISNSYVIDRTVELNAGDSREFETQVSPNEETVVKYIVETSGGPCGDRDWVDSDEIYVMPDDGDDNDGELDADFSFSPTSPGVGDSVSFVSNSYSTDGITEYRWQMGDSSVKYGSSVTHQYDSPGTYTVNLRITDSEGRTDSVPRTVTVEEEPESGPTASFTWSPTAPEEEEQVQFSSTSTDPDSDIVSYSWDMGDRTSLSGSSVTHAFDSDGQYPVQLTVEDSEGNTDSVTRDVDVGSRYTECSYSISDVRLSDNNVEEGTPVTVSFTISNSGDRQHFEVDMKSNERTVRQSSALINGGDQRVFEFVVTPQENRVVKAVVTTSGEPCNYDREATSSEIYVVQDDSSGNGDQDDEENDASLTVRVRDQDGHRLDADVEVENGERYYGYTGSDGERTFTVEPGDYEITASRNGYTTESRDVYMDEGDTRTRTVHLEELEDDDRDDDREGDVYIRSIDSPESVCRGDSLRVYTEIYNPGDHGLFTLSGDGSGSTGSNSFAVGEGNTVTRSLRFTNVQGSGQEEFTLTVENGVEVNREFDVEVNDCSSTDNTPAAPSPTSISMSLGSDRTFPNDPVKVRGYVDGVNSRTEVEIQSDGETVARVSTQPDGYYQTFIREGEVGGHSISASAGDRTTYRDLEVVPTASINFVDMPDQVFQGETFEICAQVNSQIEPDIVLLRDGEIVETGSGAGEVCFDRTVQSADDYDYEIRALTYGQGASDTRSLEVLETGSEVTNFPDQIASVESGSGIVKVDIYNTHDDTRRYELELSGIDDRWISQSTKEVVLGKGERDRVYFYLTPRDEGVYRPELKVSSDGTEIHRESITVTTGGTHDEANNPGIFNRFRRMLPF